MSSMAIGHTVRLIFSRFRIIDRFLVASMKVIQASDLVFVSS